MRCAYRYGRNTLGMLSNFTSTREKRRDSDQATHGFRRIAPDLYRVMISHFTGVETSGKLTGSIAHRNSRVPTAQLASRGVKLKYEEGESIVTSS